MVTVFFGTPAFAVPPLQALLKAGHRVAAVVTQPDRPQGRSRSTLVPPPVKVAALEAGIPVLQPEKPVGPDFEAALAELGADIGVVVAYGHILRPHVLAIPRLGMVNVHASLLPRWRGAAPIQWAIKSGDDVTGVSIMRMEQGLDSGPVWLTRSMKLTDTMTTGEVMPMLAALGAAALVETLPLIASGAEPVPQDPGGVILAPKISRDLARIDWDSNAREVARHINAFDPAPGAWTTLGGSDVKLFAAAPVEGSGIPGSIDRHGDALEIATASGRVRIGAIQLPGRKRQPVAEFLRGQALPEGAVLS